MKTREWLFTIAIIILIQFIVQVGALIYSSNNNVLNYISFAGTIVSIILATIAIVYSFVQTISQQSASSNISNQVDKLISVAGVMEENKNTIKNSIDHLNKASERLDIAIENQSNINQEVKKISEKISTEKFYEKFLSEDTNNTTTDPRDNSSTLDAKLISFKKWPNGIKIASILLFFGEKNNYSLSLISKKLVPQVLGIVFPDKKDYEKASHFQEGIILATAQMLTICNLLNEKDNKISLNSTLRNECHSYIESIKLTEEEGFDKEFINAYEKIEKNLNN